MILCALLIVLTAILSHLIDGNDKGIGIGTPIGDFKFSASLGYYHYRYFEKRGQWDVVRIDGAAYQMREFNEAQNRSPMPRFFRMRNHSARSHGVTVRYAHAMTILGFIALGSLAWIHYQERRRQSGFDGSVR